MLRYMQKLGLGFILKYCVVKTLGAPPYGAAGSLLPGWKIDKYLSDAIHSLFLNVSKITLNAVDMCFVSLCRRN